MLPALRKKFLLIAMASLIGTMAFLCVTLNLVNYLRTTHRVDAAIQVLYKNGGSFPAPDGSTEPDAAGGFQITEETQYESRYFIVTLSPEREVLSVNVDHIAAIDRQSAVSCIGEILSSDENSGYLEHGRYRYQVFQDKDSSTIVVVNCFLQTQAMTNVLDATVLVGLACVGIVFLLLLVLSKRLIYPFAENAEKQRQFVTNASHELKTPLAIISADVGMLEMDLGADKWLISIQNQVNRLDRLIRDLIELARSEEPSLREEKEDFLLSEIVAGTAEDFIPLAEAQGKSLTVSIPSTFPMNGQRDAVARLCTLLLDNAVKYCDQAGTIQVKLFRRGRMLVLAVSNPCAGVSAEEIPKFFDRFYRGDPSRAHTGGYGIGLSTARAIVQRHKGKITARYEAGVITFLVMLPA